ncbi:hypothetical protein ACOSP7_007247 [Xanthoceras sorbifolium]
MFLGVFLRVFGGVSRDLWTVAIDKIFVFSAKLRPKISEEVKEKPYVTVSSKQAQADDGDLSDVARERRKVQLFLGPRGSNSMEKNGRVGGINRDCSRSGRSNGIGLKIGNGTGASSSGGKTGGSRFEVLEEDTLVNADVEGEN